MTEVKSTGHSSGVPRNFVQVGGFNKFSWENGDLGIWGR